MKRLLFLLLLAMPLFAVTLKNDDSCDIGLYPAATLLLPYFEVDLDAGETTIFTVTNTSPQARAARVTLWTDYGYPVLSFNIFLTGYDVHSINLFDVIARGSLQATGVDVSPRGSRSIPAAGTLLDGSCDEVPGQLPQAFINRMKSAFTLGRVPAAGDFEACDRAGGTHQNAVGYATVDVVALCSASMPIDPIYFTHELRYDNVLMGDYIQVDGGKDFAQANPMVHIRAIPEGGDLTTRKKTAMPRTFYSRLQPSVNATADARQPLPSTFAARWIEGGATGFETFFKVWRETRVGTRAACADYHLAANMPFAPVRFDEEENPEVFAPQSVTLPLPGAEIARTIPSALLSTQDSTVFPHNPVGAVGGWMYFNLDDSDNAAAPATQNWVVVSMRAENRFSVDFGAVALNNGCTPAIEDIDELLESPE